MSSNLKKYFGEQPAESSQRRARAAKVQVPIMMRPSLEEVQKKYPDYDPAPCMYICGSGTDSCDKGRSCAQYAAWASRYKAKARAALEERMSAHLSIKKK